MLGNDQACMTPDFRAFLAVSASNQLIDLDYSNEVLLNQQGIDSVMTLCFLIHCAPYEEH
ncbi:hypothetical protein INR49_009202 [Caranx melampygus]|nr:hypothetical protein INR49_009202 [Caranx melampygus]